MWLSGFVGRRFDNGQTQRAVGVQMPRYNTQYFAKLPYKRKKETKKHCLKQLEKKYNVKAGPPSVGVAGGLAIVKGSFLCAGLRWDGRGSIADAEKGGPEPGDRRAGKEISFERD